MPAVGFCLSGGGVDVEKGCQRCFRTQASASENVGFVLRYQAVCRTLQTVFFIEGMR